MLSLLVFPAILNLASWAIPGFSDWYAESVFPVITAPLARLTSLLPFSVGEWMLLAAVLWILILLILTAAGLIAAVKARSADTRIVRAARRFLRATCWLLAVVMPVMTLNCFILYHTTPLEESLPGYGKEYTIAELGELRDYIVEKCNALAEEMPRDETGEVVYEGGAAAMEETAREAVERLGQMSICNTAGPAAAADTSDSGSTASGSAESDTEEAACEAENLPSVLSRLCGFQVTAKELFFSDFVSQQYIQGYYFPFSMESNYNAIMKTMNKPSTICHELAHTHGFIYEDEANLIGFLACIYSDDVIFRYSGWLSVLNYVNNSFYANVDEATYQSHVSISDRVRFDNKFLSDEAWEEVEEDALLSTEVVKAATDTYLDTTLKANGVESGKASYTHVVELLLMYYDGVYE